MDYGISSVYILQSLRYFNNKYNNGDGNYKLISIDSCQIKCWQGLGIENLKNANLLSHHKLKERASYVLLPDLINRKKIYDIVFIDSWNILDDKEIDLLDKYRDIKKYGFNTVEYILNDIINSYHLVKINGYLIINNVLNPGISEILKYVEKNYHFLEKINTGIKSMVVYLKKNKK